LKKINSGLPFGNKQKYKKVFGVGPLGALISIVLSLPFWWLEQALGQPAISQGPAVQRILGGLLIMGLSSMAGYFAPDVAPACYSGRKTILEIFDDQYREYTDRTGRFILRLF